MARKKSGKGKEKKRKPAPAWAAEPFRVFLNGAELVEQLLHLSINGIAMLRGRPGAIEALAPFVEHTEERTAEDDDQRAEELKRAKLEAELAQREIDNGFPLLHAQAMVSLWGSLEALFRAFLVAWLKNDHAARRIEAVQKLKIRLLEYESMDEEERYFYTIDL